MICRSVHMEVTGVRLYYHESLIFVPIFLYYNSEHKLVRDPLYIVHYFKT